MQVASVATSLTRSSLHFLFVVPLPTTALPALLNCLPNLTACFSLPHYRILATNKHPIVLLSRTSKPDLSSLGIDIRPVDSYTDQALLVSALQGVHTVISCIASFDDERTQLRLLEAAKEVGSKRFSPSVFAMRVGSFSCVARFCDAGLCVGLDVDE